MKSCSLQCSYSWFRCAVALSVLLAVIASATGAVACPTCKDGLAAGNAAFQAAAQGYFYSILFMMAMPFVIVGTFGSAAYFSIRRARDRHVSAVPQDE